MFVVLKVDHDHEGNEWLSLKNIYDNVESCHLYINKKRASDEINIKYNHFNFVTLYHKREIDEKVNVVNKVYHHNFNGYNIKCDYVIEEINMNQDY
jgi:hypothetical protein